MQEVSLSVFEEMEKKYEDAVNYTAEKYKCEWDDSVHESFKKYIDNILNCSAGVKRIKTSTEDNLKIIENMNIDNMVEASKQLGEEVESL